jgi:hypothetical protein
MAEKDVTTYSCRPWHKHAMRAASNLVGRAAQHNINHPILWRSTRGPTPECQAFPRRVRLALPDSTPLHSTRPRPPPACSSLAPRPAPPLSISIPARRSSPLNNPPHGALVFVSSRPQAAVHGHRQPRALAAPRAVLAPAEPPPPGGRRRHLPRHHRHVPPARRRR